MANENPESASLNGFLSHGMAWEHFWDFNLISHNLHQSDLLLVFYEFYGNCYVVHDLTHPHSKSIYVEI